MLEGVIGTGKVVAKEERGEFGASDQGKTKEQEKIGGAGGGELNEEGD